MQIDELRGLAKQVRLDGLEMAKTSGRGGAHLGGSFSAVEILTVLYGYAMRFDPEKPEWDGRDRFLPSKNHCVLAHLPVLARSGFFDVAELQEFQKNGGRLTGYPLRPEIGLEYSGGSLGMAISVGVGQALTLSRFYDVDPELVYTAAAYHDTGLCADRKTHHVVSARIIREDARLREWFSEEQIETIAQAAEDHRASSDHAPRTVYGRLIAEADRQIIPETVIARTMAYSGAWPRTASFRTPP